MKKFVCLLLPIMMVVAVFGGCDVAEKTNDNNLNNKEMIETKHNEVSDEIELTKGNSEIYESIITIYRSSAELCINYKDEKSINAEYSTIFDAHDEMANSIFSSTFLLYPRNSDGLCKDGYKHLGYTIKDLNDDNVEELILRRSDDMVIAIFTIVDDVPKLVDCYWDRYSCWIDPDGLLHVHGSSGADRSTNAIYEISNVGELVLLWECGTDGYDENTFETIYYKITGGEKHHITKDQYDDFCGKSPYIRFDASFRNPEYLVFIPLFDYNYVSKCMIDEVKG